MSTFRDQHLPCPLCNSSDAYAIDHNNIGHCFSCGCTYDENSKKRTSFKKTNSVMKKDKKQIELGVYRDLTDRCITSETCTLYKYQVSTDNTKHIANITDVAQKIRFTATKRFLYINKPETERLYGDFAFTPDKSKTLIITEGEIDAMSTYQITNIPSVSITHGTKSARKCILDNINYIKGFKNVLVLFDNDEAGVQASADAFKVLSKNGINYGTCEYPSDCKDANECLVKGFEIDLFTSITEASINDTVIDPHTNEPTKQDNGPYYVAAQDGFYFLMENSVPRRLPAKYMLEHYTLVEGIDKDIAKYTIANARNPSSDTYCSATAELPYQKQGRIEIEGTPYLNTSNMKVVEPKDGVPVRLLKFFKEIWGEDQMMYMLYWMKHLYIGCRSFNMQPGQAIYLAGDQGAGKNLFHDKILGALVGKGSDATQLVTSQFNGLVYRSAYATIADKFSMLNDKERVKLFSIIKDAVANGEVTVNPKYGSQYQMKWCGRLILSMNLGTNSADALPLAEPEDMQKYSLIRCTRHSMIEETSREEWDHIVKTEIEYLAHYLLNLEVPKDMLDKRFGVCAYHNKELLEEVEIKSPNHRYSELILEYLVSSNSRKISDTSGELFDVLKRHDDLKPEHLRFLPTSMSLVGFGRKLTSLCKQYPWIEKNRGKTGITYTITRDKFEEG